MYYEYFVYVLKDENGIIRYIGKTGDYEGRIKSHFKKSSNRDIRMNINENWTHDHVFYSDDEMEVLNFEKQLIEKHKHQIYNVKRSGGVSGKHNNDTTLKLKNIKSGEIMEFKTQREAAIFLKKHKSTISYLVLGKRQHISGKWTLENTNTENLVMYPRKKGYIRDDPKNYFNLYDRKTNQYITFKSVTDCAYKIKSDTTSISHLRDGRIKSLIRGRYTLSPTTKIRYKNIKVFDNVENVILEYDTMAEFGRTFNISYYMVSIFKKGEIEILQDRFTLIE